jgi:hypothetical protein
MSLAQWVTLPNLGSFIENYNFNLNPFNINVGSDTGAIVTTLNGSLPPGINYTKINSNVVLNGQSTGVTVPTTYYFTLRVTDPDGILADRTYNMTITPIPVVPSWEGVTPFLGYMTVNTTANFTVAATISNNAVITYSLIPAPTVEFVPAGMTINAQTGVITYINSVVLPVPPYYDEIFTATVVATSGTGSENLTITIIVLGRDHVPGWISPPGTLGTYIIDSWVEYIFLAYDPNGSTITYTLSNPPAGFPFALTYNGFLYGEAPLTPSTMVWTFTVDATTNLGTSSEVFEITVIAGPGNQIIWNSSDNGELGTWYDGQFVAIYVQATSQRSQRLVYEFIGGSLPPTLKLNTAQGVIAGFLDYHPQPKNYYFEINVTDGVQFTTLQYHMLVERSRLDKFIDVNLPANGQIKQALWETQGAMVASPLMLNNVNIEPMDLIDSMNIVSGLSFQYDDANGIMQQICQQAHSTNLLIGSTSNSDINTTGYTVFYRNIIDFQANASPSTTRLVGNILSGSSSLSYIPISINNVRDTLISNVGFVNDGGGSGATFDVFINQYTTGIQNVFVSDSGFGYYSAPSLVVIGSGNGAVVTANLSVQSITVTNGGNGWTQGEVFNVIIDNCHTLQLQASLVGFNGYLQSVAVIDGSEFTVFPRGNKIISDPNAAIATVSFDLGVSSVNVVEIGSGYNPLTAQIITTTGYEILPIWQPTWTPILYIAGVNLNYSNAVWSITTPQVEDILSNIVWTVQWLELVAQGRSWAGNTMFDFAQCDFDGGQTRFVESIEPKDTIFDFDGDTTFDMQGTVFDGNQYQGGFMEDMWGTNIWSPKTTFFEVYTNLLADVDVTTVSNTEVKRVYRLKSQRVGNYNRSV